MPLLPPLYLSSAPFSSVRHKCYFAAASRFSYMIFAPPTFPFKLLLLMSSPIFVSLGLALTSLLPPTLSSPLPSFSPQLSLIDLYPFPSSPMSIPVSF